MSYPNCPNCDHSMMLHGKDNEKNICLYFDGQWCECE